MLATTETLMEKGFKNQIIKDWDVASIFEGSPARRYALINKALKKGEIEHLCRGLYMLGPKYRSQSISKYFVASRMVSSSYISLETALAYHGLIPERVNIVRSIIAKGRTRRFNTSLGEFDYIKIPIREYEFLTGVLRQESNGNPFLIASPLRALLDMVYVQKIKWQGLNFMVEGLRIELDDLCTLKSCDFDELTKVYSSKRVLNFLQLLRKTLEK